MFSGNSNWYMLSRDIPSIHFSVCLMARSHFKPGSTRPPIKIVLLNRCTSVFFMDQDVYSFRDAGDNLDRIKMCQIYFESSSYWARVEQVFGHEAIFMFFLVSAGTL